MIKETTITLIGNIPKARGVFEDVPTRTERTVCCTERSLGLKMLSTAQNMGLDPSIRIGLANEFTYRGETHARYHGRMYRIVQTYPIEKYNGIELLLQEEG